MVRRELRGKQGEWSGRDEGVQMNYGLDTGEGE